MRDTSLKREFYHKIFTPFFKIFNHIILSSATPYLRYPCSENTFTEINLFYCLVGLRITLITREKQIKKEDQINTGDGM